ncbi:MAG: methyltransferase domain-containing protein [Cryobacterium sp.]
MSLQNFSEWLRCPNCFLPLRAQHPLQLVCAAGHSFDVNKQGFLTVLPQALRFIGDSAPMLDAREQFLALGFYDDLRATVATLIADESPTRILDIGCGSGFYLDAALSTASVPAGTPQALAVDLSPAAVRRTVRTLPAVHGLVADVWSPLPLRDACTDVILNVFAPRNPPEFHRVLTPSGLLLIVIPQTNHLQELRAVGLALGVQADKVSHLQRTLGGHFRLSGRASLQRSMALDAAGVRALLGMGPSAHHTDTEAVTALLAAATGTRTEVTAAFDVLSFRPLAHAE